MVNRLLIRIKTVQMVYACLQSQEPRMYVDEKLTESLEASHKLYNYLLALIVKVTDYRRTQLETARNKYFATAEERNPNTRFIDNQVARLISERSEVLDFCQKEQLTSDFDTDLYRSLLTAMEQNDMFQNYMSQKETPTFADDVNLWVEMLNNVFPTCEKLDEVMEEKNIFWNDDLTTVLQTVVRSLSKLKPETDLVVSGKTFRNDEDRHFALDLFHHSLDDYHENERLIDTVAPNWETNRMALMDKVIMCCALAEIKHFANIAVAVSINEYLELSKHYCSPNSARFINGVLDKVVKEWRTEQVIIKA